MSREPNPTTLRLSEEYHKKISFIKEALQIPFDSEVIRRSIDNFYEIVKKAKEVFKK